MNAPTNITPKKPKRSRAFTVVIGCLIGVLCAAFVGLILFIGNLPVDAEDEAVQIDKVEEEEGDPDKAGETAADAQDEGQTETADEPESAAEQEQEPAPIPEPEPQPVPIQPDPVPEAPDANGQTSGPPFSIPASVLLSPYNAAGAVTGNGAAIDVSSLSGGYVAVSCQNGSRLKFQVRSGDMAYNYDLPNDGTPIACPLNMGDGTYTFRVMQNTQGNSYVELLSTTQGVGMSSGLMPYLRPNVFCNYTSGSACVTQAKSLAAGCANQGDVLRNIYNWIVNNISYDYDKAAQLANATGYIPSPDATLNTNIGICFDYSSLAAAMLRSLGIPCMIVTGYVEPDGIYHAWNMVWLDGTWVAVGIDVRAGTWTRLDTTFAASGADLSGLNYADVYYY